RILSGLPLLEELNLYRTKVGNNSLDTLKKLKNLAEVDLRYSRATTGGVEALRASLPSARVLYVELSSRPQPAKDVARLTGMEWVKAVGGKQLPGGGISLAGAALTDAQLGKLASLPHTRVL